MSEHDDNNHPGGQERHRMVVHDDGISSISSQEDYRRLMRTLATQRQHDVTQLTPGLAQLWCYMLELQDREPPGSYVSDRQAATTADEIKPFRLLWLSFICQILTTKNRRDELLNPSKYELLDTAKDHYQQDLAYYLQDEDNARQKIIDDLNAPSVRAWLTRYRVTAPSTEVLCVLIAVATGNTDLANRFCERFGLTQQNFIFTNRTVLGDAIIKHLSPWNRYIIDDLFKAAKANDVTVLVRLQQQGNLDINAKDGNALYQALARCNITFVEKILELGATVSERHFFAAGYAAKEHTTAKATKLRNLLFTKDDNPAIPTDDDKLLYDAAGRGDVETVQRLLDDGANINPQHFFIAGWAAKNHGQDKAFAVGKLLTSTLNKRQEAAARQTVQSPSAQVTTDETAFVNTSHATARK